MAVDADSKHLSNGFSYLEKDKTRDTSTSSPTNDVLKLTKSLFKHGCNVTCDNFFTSPDVAVHLEKEKCSLVDIISQNCRTAPGCQNKETAT